MDGASTVIGNRSAYMKVYREKNREHCLAYGREYTKAKREKDRAGYNETMRAYRRANIARRLMVEARYRAKQRGVPFLIDESDVIVPTHCPILGMELAIGNGSGPSDNSFTLDRIVPSLGYVKGNVWVISAKANRIKSNATAAEIRAVADALDRIAA